MPSVIGRWKALRPVMRPMPPARLLMTAVFAASAKSCSPLAPPELIRGAAAQIAIRQLVARHLDGMIAGREVGVDALVGFAELQRGVAAVVFGEFLLDDVGLDRDAEMIGLAGEVGGDVVIFVGGFERVVSQVAPENRHKPIFMGLGKPSADFLNLTVGFCRSRSRSWPPPPAAPMSTACLTSANWIWSYLLG